MLGTAFLPRHNFILLGLRGQAKSRILRQLVTLLDEEIPILAGSEVNDNPFAPISKYGRERVTEQDRKSTRLNSSHGYISYAVFCLKKKKKNTACTDPIE